MLIIALAPAEERRRQLEDLDTRLTARILWHRAILGQRRLMEADDVADHEARQKRLRRTRWRVRCSLEIRVQ